jgi:hypothetical protein
MTPKMLAAVGVAAPDPDGWGVVGSGRPGKPSRSHDESAATASMAPARMARRDERGAGTELELGEGTGAW